MSRAKLNIFSSIFLSILSISACNNVEPENSGTNSANLANFEIKIKDSNTFLKRQLSTDTSDDEKGGTDFCTLYANDKYQLYAAAKMKENHLLVNIVDFNQNGCSFSKGYVYKAHLTRKAIDRTHVYTTGNIGPTSTGPHLDIKQKDGGRFELSVLDRYVEVDDRDHGTVSLSKLRQLTGYVGDSWDEHYARYSHGWDVGTYSGTKVYLINGARRASRSYWTKHGDETIIILPNGKRYTFLHGRDPEL